MTHGIYITGMVNRENIVYFRFKATSLAPPGDAGVRRAFGSNKIMEDPMWCSAINCANFRKIKSGLFFFQFLRIKERLIIINVKLFLMMLS